MKVSIAKIRKTLIQALVSRKVPLKKAKIIAADYLEGELQGKVSHGLMAFPSLLEKLPLKTKPVKVVKKTQAMIVYDAGENLGAVVAQQAVDWLSKAAKKQGIAMALITNMTTWLRPGAVAQKLAEKNLVGLVVNNGGRPMTAPPGGFEPVVGTNPIGIGVPATDKPFLTDMATSVRAWGEVRKAEASGENLPKDSYYDNKGNFAIKAQDAYAALPAGGYKGFALGLLIEILTGSLLGRPMGKTQMKGDYRTMTRGGVIIAIDPSQTTTLTKFKKANARLGHEIKYSKKLKGVREIRLPGEKALKTKQANLKKGYLIVRDNLWQKLSSR